jgi:hypothetical protein
MKPMAVVVFVAMCMSFAFECGRCAGEAKAQRRILDRDRAALTAYARRGGGGGDVPATDELFAQAVAAGMRPKETERGN